jgi:hypothetical protein
LTAYALPAAAAWALLGLGLGALALGLGALGLGPRALSLTALIAMAGYGACYGLAEVAGRPMLRPPGSWWQVPQSFVKGASRRRRLLIWGSVLGPGFATRNPYAGFGLLPLAVAAAGSVPAAVALAAAVGVAHGAGRAVALLRDAGGASGADPLQLVLRSLYWRRLDGFALLIAAVLAVTQILGG